MQDEEWDDDDDLEGADYGKGEFDYLSCMSATMFWYHADIQLGSMMAMEGEGELMPRKMTTIFVKTQSPRSI